MPAYKPVLACQHHAQLVNIFDKRTIQILWSDHHLRHRPFVIFHTAFVKITEKQKICFFIINIFITKCAYANFRPGSENGHNNCTNRRGEKYFGGNS